MAAQTCLPASRYDPALSQFNARSCERQPRQGHILLDLTGNLVLRPAVRIPHRTLQHYMSAEQIEQVLKLRCTVFDATTAEEGRAPGI
jgi:hypothetical protein